jgi:hypothetical protein
MSGVDKENWYQNPLLSDLRWLEELSLQVKNGQN